MLSFYMLTFKWHLNVKKDLALSIYSITKVRRPENQVLSGGKHRTVGVSFLLRSCCHKKTHRDHYDSGKQQES